MKIPGQSLQWKKISPTFLLGLFLLTTACEPSKSSSPKVVETNATSPTYKIRERERTKAKTERNSTSRVDSFSQPIIEIVEKNSLETNRPLAATNLSVVANNSLDSFKERLSAITGQPSSDKIIQELKGKAEQGDVESQYKLGLEYGKLWNLEESNKWYLKAAEQGNADAQHMMGVRYILGQGVERDPTEAVKWFLKAAEQGEVNSQFSIGLRYVQGEAVPQDFNEAAKWFALAAEQGLSEAQLSLGQRYAAGEGVAQDKIEALKWYEISTTSGNPQAESVRDEFQNNLTPAEIAEAK
ncbi:MAG: sel1 repeat family protein, partial [Verrucomicrobiota bacterium]|nr:sel1 repeat family protein [Verrucomicrobiota bacterium]